MLAFSRYMVRYYVRSHQYAAPLLVFLVSLFIVYSGGVSDVLATYSMGAVLTFLISTWLAYGYTRVEHSTQKQITILKMGGISRYVRAKLCFICVTVALIALCSVLYPVLILALTAHMTWGFAFTALIEAVSFALVGVGIGMFFDDTWFPRKTSALLILAFVSLLSVIGEQIGAKLPHDVQWIVWVVTPISHTVYSAGRWTSLSRVDRVLMLTWTFVYSIILFMIYSAINGKGARSARRSDCGER